LISNDQTDPGDALFTKYLGEGQNVIVIDAMRFNCEHPRTPEITAVLEERPFAPEK